MSFPVILTVKVIEREQRDKFRALARPDTYRRIRPHTQVGARGCYEVEMTEEEYTQALSDALEPDSNLIAAERSVEMRPDSVPNQQNLDYAGIRRLSEDGYDATGVAVAVIDRGITTAFRDAHFAGRVEDAEDFTGEANPYSLYGGDEHGCYMSGLAVPPESDLVVAKVNLTSDVAEAFYWIADETTAEIISISQSTDTPSTALNDAVDYARDAGLLIFASMGNDGAVHTNYPAASDGAHAISNFDNRTDAISPDSTFGSHVWAAAGGNDHNLWNASGAEIYLEAGGTSCATAMAARIAAYVVGKFGTGTAISRMEDTARDAGAASNKQGAGVLRLVHAYEMPDGEEPAVPVIPVGQSRDHGIELPELPPIGGPGDGENPGGVNPTEEPASGCADSVLTSLVDAYETSSDPSDLDALISYVEEERGQAIEALLEPQWSATTSDGETRQKTIAVHGCDVTFTIDGSPVSGGGCTLGTKTMTLGTNDFSAPTIPIGLNPGPWVAASSPSPENSIFTTTDTLPDWTIHIEDPVMVYLTPGDPLIGKWAIGTTVSIGGVSYRSAIRVKLSYTIKVEKKTHYLWNYEVAPSDTPTGDQDYIDEHYTSSKSWSVGRPNVGLRSLLRTPEGTGSPPYYTDPLSYGTVNTSLGEATSEDYNAALSDSATYMNNTNRALPRTNASLTRFTEFGAAGSLGEMDDLIQAEVDAWNDERGAMDPIMSFDSAVGEVTLSLDTDQTAIYLQGPPCSTLASRARANVTVDGGGFVHKMGDFSPFDSRTAGFTSDYLGAVVQRLVQGVDTATLFAEDTGWYDRQAEGTFESEISAASASGSPDGRPPDTEPNPPIVPVGGGCRSAIDGPSSCTWHIPDDGDIPLPGDNFPDMPVVDVKFPKFPPIGCQFPDFGNMDPCGPGSGPPGMNGPLPGGRDRRGKRGHHHGSVKTGGPTYGDPRKVTFGERTCPGKDLPGISCFSVIMMLLMDCGISPLDIIFQVTSEWDKPFPVDKCFRARARIWDAAEWTARFLGLKIIDEGKPTNNIYIGPPWHRPGQSTWHFYEHYDLFALDRGFSSDELYGYVEVFGPNGSAISFVDSPFVTEDSPGLPVEVGANHSQADMNRLAAYKASLIRRDATSVQITVPYSNEYFLRDKAVTHAPDKGMEERWIIVGKESDLATQGRYHILTLMLPETVRELDELPTSVGTVAEEVPGTEFVFT